MSKQGLLLMASLAVVVFPLSSLSQTGKVYEDNTNGFRINLIGDWRAVSYNDAVGRHKSEFVYRDRSEALRVKLGSFAVLAAIAVHIRYEVTLEEFGFCVTQ